MALIWADGFDHYGTDETNMLDGVYANYDGEISTGQVATGTHAFYFNQVGGLSTFDGLRKVLPSAVTTLGAAARFYFPQLPTRASDGAIFHFLPSDSTANSQISFQVGLNGEIIVIKNCSTYGGTISGTTIATTDPLITAGAYNHIEVQAYIHDTAGWVRIAVNGIERYESSNNLDTKGSASSSTVSSVAQSRALLAESTSVFYMDDYYIYDFTGTPAVYTDWAPSVDGSGIATEFMGEWQCMYLPVNGDTAEADWVPSTGSTEYEAIDEVNPDDADYVYSTTAGDLSEYELTDLPEDITVIRGLQIIGRLSKSDSGPAMIQYGMKSVAATEDAAERPVTVEPTYWWDFINEDPNNPGNRWTRASLNAAWVRITRSA
jgi:hypothetical protein